MSLKGELIPSNRKGNFLHIGGYLYFKHSVKDDTTYWNCREKKICKARAVTTDNLKIKRGPDDSPHNHASNPDEVEALRVQARIKAAATDDPAVAPARILRREMHTLPNGTVPSFITFFASLLCLCFLQKW